MVNKKEIEERDQDELADEANKKFSEEQRRIRMRAEFKRNK